MTATGLNLRGIEVAIGLTGGLGRRATNGGGGVIGESADLFHKPRKDDAGKVDCRLRKSCNLQGPRSL